MNKYKDEMSNNVNIGTSMTTTMLTRTQLKVPIYRAVTHNKNNINIKIRNRLKNKMDR